jgi:hypothetical protein
MEPKFKSQTKKAARIAAWILGIFAAVLLVAQPAARAFPPLQPLVDAMPGLTSGPVSTMISFTVTCDTTVGGVTVQDNAEGPNWSTLYCENNSTTTVYWGGADVAAADSPCISTTSANCLKSSFSVDARRGSIKCLTAASSATLKCNAGQ